MVHRAEASGLVNGPLAVATTLKLQMLARVTSEGGTWIAHILHTDRHNNIHCIGANTLQGSEWMTISDHSLIWTRYILHSVHASTTTLLAKVLPSVHASTTNPLVKVASREFIELPLTDKERNAFVADMDK